MQSEADPTWSRVSDSRAAETKYRPDIDGLRAVAVVGVIIYHAMPQCLSGGFVGVDVFFVISGFLITSIIRLEIKSGSFSFLNFYRRRIRRILPALIVVIAAVLFIGLFVLWPNQFAQLGLHILAASTFSSNYLLAAEAGYFDTAAQSKPLLHLWSLAIEEQFYLIWPVLLLVALKFSLKTKNMLFIILIASFAYSEINNGSTWAFYSLPSRSWELALGALLAIYRKPAATTQPIYDAASVIGLALIVTSMVALVPTSLFPGWRALVPTFGTAILIATGPSTPIGRLLSIRPLVAIGLISYPLYLWHWPLLSFASIAGVKLTPLAATAIVGIALLLAWLTYRFIETPIRSGASIKFRRYAPAFLAVLLLGTGMLGMATQWSNGLAFRFSKVQIELADFHFDQYQAYRGLPGGCFLALEQAETAFGKDCVPQQPDRPLVALWGDSHAAQLYPGLETLQTETGIFLLAQLTASACPPILEVDLPLSPHCRAINDFVIRKITEMRPKIAVLAASWWAYPTLDLTRLRYSVEKLRVAGVERIILVGPVPIWNPSLPEILLNHSKKTRDLPYYLSDGLTKMTELDRNLGEITRQNESSYFSVLDVFCNAYGCLTRTSADISDLTAWDSAHLTSVGSRFLISKMPLLAAIKEVSRHKIVR